MNSGGIHVSAPEHSNPPERGPAHLKKCSLEVLKLVSMLVIALYKKYIYKPKNNNNLGLTANTAIRCSEVLSHTTVPSGA